MYKLVELQSDVPFGEQISAWLAVRDLHLNEVIKRDQMEEHYLAWETVRKESNPFFREGTGFEGYLVGRCTEPEAALEVILAIHQQTLDSITRLYRYEFRFRSQLMKTLTRERSDPAAIHVWSAQLGAELGKLRVEIFHSAEAKTFQSQTYQVIKELPPMVFNEAEDRITQRYAVASGDDAAGNKLAITWQMLKPSQQDAWLVAANIGEFGHPLVRKLLDGNPPLLSRN